MRFLMEFLRRTESAWAHAPLGALILLIPALINGFPFWWHDTAGYYLVGHGIISHLGEVLHGGSAVEAALPAAAAPVEVGAGATTAAPGSEENGTLTYVGGRSALYSLLVYFGSALGTYWLVAGAQALVAAWLVSAALRATGLNGSRPFFIAVIALTALSALPYFAATLMPDVFTGYAFIAIVLLFAATDRFSQIERIALALLLAAALASHQTNLPIAVLLILLAAAGAAFARVERRDIMRRAAWASAPVALALAFNTAYAAGTTIVLGEAPSSPPYLMARVLEDGPGRLYLREACAPEPRYEVCRYADRGFKDANQFLWVSDPEIGVYMPADTASRHKMLEQERAFVLGAVSRYPLMQLGASVSHALALAWRYQVGPELRFSQGGWTALGFRSFVPPVDARAAEASLVYNNAYPLGLVDFLNGAALIAALGFLGWRLSGGDVRAAFATRGFGVDEEANMRKLMAAAAIALFAWLAANAALCGALSGVFPRYQARTLWLIPLLAVLAYLRLGWRRPGLASPPS